MTYRELKDLSLFFKPALILEGIISYRSRMNILGALFFLATFLFIPFLLYYGADYSSTLANFINVYPAALFLIPKLAGLFYLCLFFWLIVFLAQTFFYSSYFRSLDSIISEKGIEGREPISFEAAVVIDQSPADDFTAGFLKTDAGMLLMRRLGISSEEVDNFLKSRTRRIRAEEIFLDDLADEEYGVTFADLTLALVRSDSEFSHFLFAKKITDADLRATSLWLVRDFREAKLKERWWSRDFLGRIPGIGKDWAYGGAYILEKYEKVSFDRNRFSVTTTAKFLNEEVEKLERVLVRSKEANALIVGEAGSGAVDVVYRFARLIFEGRVLPPLEDKRVFFLDTNKLITNTAEKVSFEKELIKIFEESIKAGNIILVFDNFPAFLESAGMLGSNAFTVMDPYLSSSDLQVIAVADPERYHKTLRTNSALMSRFEIILLKEETEGDMIRVAQSEVARYEKRLGIFFTYQAVREIVRSARRYFPDSPLPDKTSDLIAEVASKAVTVKKRTIEIGDVNALIESKTGIPLREVGQEEKDRLLALEEILHKRVIGQEEVVKAVAGALRRARSGIGNPNRPMGSFLFLGPTGVGKTETAKALAESFFGDENRIIRFDMSEYRGLEALPKLIGSADDVGGGILSTRLRENPYGVLLLDEFEKTTGEVMNLFLQVLDEGFFSDGSGKRVNARNLIIIATSNAAADLIWDYVKAGEEHLGEKKNEIVDYLVKEGIFPPELINRFDAVILFHPIVGEILRKVAQKQLEQLRLRLKERGVDLTINDFLVDFLVKVGSDPKFGARPMNRAIQDRVEQAIADKILKGEIRPGDKVVLSQSDFS
jgi:ATP-dependent Clp protease ATP-binding subunit ClpC